MSVEYNSLLIQRLYESASVEKAIEILKEMEEIGDAIFINPIFSAFKKYSVTASSHYFVGALEYFDSPGIMQIVSQICREPMKIINYIYCLPILSKYGDYSDVNIKNCKYLLNILIDNPKKSEIDDEWNLTTVLHYLFKANKLVEVESQLVEIFNKDDLDRETKEVSLRFLIKSNPDKNLDLITLNYFTYNEICKILISKQILKWTGKKVDVLKNLIKSESGRPKEIIEEQEKKTEQKAIVDASQIKQKEVQEYGNIKRVISIVKLKEEINFLSNGNDRIHCDLLEMDESLMLQSQSIVDLNGLENACDKLRISILSINSSIEIPKGLDEKIIRSIFPTIELNQLNKTVNKLCLFLHCNGINVDPALYGIRKLNSLISLIGPHKNERSKLIKVLKEQGFYELYKSGKFGQVHTKLLDFYYESLNKIKLALSEQSQVPDQSKDLTKLK